MRQFEASEYRVHELTEVCSRMCVAAVMSADVQQLAHVTASLESARSETAQWRNEASRRSTHITPMSASSSPAVDAQREEARVREIAERAAERERVFAQRDVRLCAACPVTTLMSSSSLQAQVREHKAADERARLHTALELVQSNATEADAAARSTTLMRANATPAAVGGEA
jgi:hypothetical protein